MAMSAWPPQLISQQEVDNLTRFGMRSWRNSSITRLIGLPLSCQAYSAWVARRRERERAVLRMAAYELRFRADVPYRVVLNEAIEVTKRFGAEHGHTYVNGVLDKAAHEWRPAESTRG